MTWLVRLVVCSHAVVSSQEWRLVRQPVSVPKFWQEVLERKVLPEVRPS